MTRCSLLWTKGVCVAMIGGHRADPPGNEFSPVVRMTGPSARHPFLQHRHGRVPLLADAGRAGPGPGNGAVCVNLCWAATPSPAPALAAGVAAALQPRHPPVGLLDGPGAEGCPIRPGGVGTRTLGRLSPRNDQSELFLDVRALYSFGQIPHKTNTHTHHNAQRAMQPNGPHTWQMRMSMQSHPEQALSFYNNNKKQGSEGSHPGQNSCIRPISRREDSRERPGTSCGEASGSGTSQAEDCLSPPSPLPWTALPLPLLSPPSPNDDPPPPRQSTAGNRPNKCVCENPLQKQKGIWLAILGGIGPGKPKGPGKSAAKCIRLNATLHEEEGGGSTWGVALHLRGVREVHGPRHGVDAQLLPDADEVLQQVPRHACLGGGGGWQAGVGYGSGRRKTRHLISYAVLGNLLSQDYASTTV